MALVEYRNEYGRLRRIALYKPLVEEIYQGDPAEAMYIEKPEPEKVLAEFDNIVNVFKGLGVEVIVLKDSNRSYKQTTNMIFLRDVAAILGNNIILANMKMDVRKYEPIKFKELILEQIKLDEDQFIKLNPLVTMEGADIQIANKSQILAYSGSRTSPNAIAEIVESLKVEAVTIPANISKIPQHLLGALHIVSPTKIARRVKYCNSTLKGFETLDFSETEEIKNKFAMNIVTIAPMEILMPSNCPVTKKQFEKNGIKCHVVDINEIHKMGGGLACMTLPLKRANS